MKSLLGSPSTVTTDVLIIGGGGAGCEAAIFAQKAGAQSTCVVEKGVIGASGCTVMGTYSCCAALGFADPRDNPQVHFEDTDAGGARIGDPELMRIYAEEAPARVLELADWGVPFEKEGGKLKQAHMEGHTYPRAVFVDMRTGQAMQWGLRRKLKKTPGIQRFNDVQVYRLLVADGRVFGAVGLSRKTLTPIRFLAKATIIATGGCGQLYIPNTTSLDNTGDGISIAFEAGAPLMDMEFVQFFPMCWVYPIFPGRNRTVSSFLRYLPGCRLLNNRGEDFISRKYPDWGKTLTRDLLSQAIFREVIEGRGSPHGGVFADVTAAGKEEIEKHLALGNLLHTIQTMGIDLKREPIEVSVASHFLMGGIQIDAQGASRVPGLFAGGEAVAGIHGANRLGGNALSEILVTGARAGEHAAQFAKNQKESPPLFSLQTEWEDWIERLLVKPRAGTSPRSFRKPLQEMMWKQAGVIRTGKNLRVCLDELSRLHSSFERDLGLSQGPGAYHMELAEAIETRLMLPLAKAIVVAALRREETRGAHLREDFPEAREEWRTNLILTRAKDEILCQKKS
jgi:succinate dehydrogenase/fumarate reductase flavoprotein subunit